MFDTQVIRVYCSTASTVQYSLLSQCSSVYLHVLVFDLLTGGNTVGDVQVDELWRQIYSCSQPEEKKQR